MTMSNTQSAVTLDELISAGLDTSVDLKAFSYLLNINDTVIPIYSVLDSYMDFITPHSKLVKLTETEATKYKYDPKKLSLDLYGTMDLWVLLLKLNRCSHPLNFVSKNVRVLDPDNLSILSKILQSESQRLNKNRLRTFENLDVNYL